MSYGIQISNALGRVVYDTSSIAWSVIASMHIAAGGLYSNVFPYLVGKEAMHQSMFSALPDPTTGANAPVVTINTTTGAVDIVGGELPAYVMIFVR